MLNLQINKPLKDIDQITPLALQMAIRRNRGETDSNHLALVIEGGGMSGVVSGGMSLVLEEMGLIDSFDLIIGCSAGSLNASYIAARQARQDALLYIDVASEKGFISKSRAFRGKPVMNLDILFDQHMIQKRPYRESIMEQKSSLHLLAFNIEASRVEALTDFNNPEEIRLATKASCTIPGVTGTPIQLRDGLYADGGLVESIPYKTALSLGATHCLVLRSRTSSYRKPPFSAKEKSLGKLLLRDQPSIIKELVSDRNRAYNQDAIELARMPPMSPVSQVCPPDHLFLPDTFESSRENLLVGFRAGIETMKNLLFFSEEDDIIQSDVNS